VPLQRILTRDSGLCGRDCLNPTANAFRFSQPPGASPPRASQPYFMPAPLLGFALQSFVPPVQPFAVSSAVPLLTSHRLAATSQAARQQMPEPEGTGQRQAVMRPAKPTPPSGSCSARESATRRRWFRPATARCSPGPSPLQGLLPRVDEHGLHRASPHAVCRPGASA
jgi:hypothetical protein